MRPLQALTAPAMRMAAAVVFVLAPLTIHAQSWAPMATISGTTSTVTNSICVSDGTDLRCDGYGGLVTTSGTLSIGSIGVGNLVAGNISTTGGVSVTGNVTATKFTGDGSGITGISGSSISTGLSGSLVYRDATGNLLGHPTISVSSTTGSLGIGAGPTSSVGNDGLYVSGSAYVNGTMYNASNFQFSSTGSRYLSWNGTGGAYLLGDATGKSIAFGTSSTEGMRLTSDSRIGINTTAPGYPLEVSGTAYATRLNAGTNATSGAINASGSLYLYNPGTGNAMSASTSNNGRLVFGTNTASGGQFIFYGNTQTYYGLTLVGIGTSTIQAPSTTLHVSGTLRIADGGESCDSFRAGALKFTGSTFYTCNGGGTWTSFSGERIVSGTTQAIAYNNTSISLVTAGVERVVVGGDGNVGIGAQPAASYMLYVNGNAYSTGTWSTSDARFKENIHSMSGLLSKVDELRPVTFTWKKNAFPAKNNPGEQIGLIAQEVEKIYPALVHTDTNGYKAVAYDRIGVLLLGAVKELKAENEELKAQNAAMLKRLEALESKSR